MSKGMVSLKESNGSLPLEVSDTEVIFKLLKERKLTKEQLQRIPIELLYMQVENGDRRKVHAKLEEARSYAEEFYNEEEWKHMKGEVFYFDNFYKPVLVEYVLGKQ